ncbi:hypothetical protein SAMN05192560_0769 [Methylobacillus rhizosphaerae]|uniref:Uncharacterized protein n=1 Tax=Methylobacillus rhizosphaerae TaxID=551994 RepID=A0A238YS36_9PROT|nr:hypothetical protein [Methylobacillus rhizosphaerae]SNR73628.1 hypothetical protein SAMN05192560_0769 [Methylobacillus rhizosphaerae]
MNHKPALPHAAQEILKEAARTSTPGGLSRRIAVDKAIERVKREWPKYFQVEVNHDQADSGE